MTAYVISSGHSAGYSLMSGDTLTVMSGGVDTGTTIGSGALETVFSGGTASGDLILAGASEVVSSGATITGGLDYGNVTAYGSAVSMTVGSGGVLILADNQIAASGTTPPLVENGALTVQSGGLLIVTSAAVIGTENYASNGSTVTFLSSGLTVEGGGVADIVDGGAAFVIVGSGGVLSAQSDGYSYNLQFVTISSGGLLTGDAIITGENHDYGVVSGLQVLGFGAGDDFEVDSGGLASELIILGGGVLFVASGGTANDTTFDSGTDIYGNRATIRLQSGGVVSNVTMADGYIYASGGQGGAAGVGGALEGMIAINDTDSATYYAGAAIDDQFIYGTVSALNRQINVSGNLIEGVGLYLDTVESGGVINNVDGRRDTILAGGSALNCYLEGVTLYSGSGSDLTYYGVDTVDYGLISGGVISADGGGYGGVDIMSGGVASAVTIISMASAGAANHVGLFVSSGGRATRTTVSSGGYMEVERGGVTDVTTILAGGTMTDSGGRLAGVTNNAGTLSGALVTSVVHVQSGGLDIGDQIRSGGEETMVAAATTSNVTIAAGGLLSGPGVISGGQDFGVVSAARITGGGSLDVRSGGHANDLNVSALLSGGTSAHQGLFVSSGGVAAGATIGSGGFADAASGGVLSGTLVASAGVLELDAGGSAVDTTVRNGALLSGAGVIGGTTQDYGTVSGVQIAGVLDVRSGATNSGTTLLSGGRENLFSGAVDTGDIVTSGGLEVVSSGARLTSAVVSHGGVLSGYDTDAVSVAVDYGAVVSIGLSNTESLDVLSGGLASAVVVSALFRNDNEGIFGQGLVVSSGGRSVGAHILSGGLIELTSGARASGTTVDAGGVIYAFGGALGGVTSNFGIVSSSTQVAGTVIVESGGYDDQDTVLSGGADRVLAGGAVADVTIRAGGVLSGQGLFTVPGQGVAQSFDYGLVSGMTVSGDAGLVVGSGGVASGLHVAALFRNDFEGIFGQGLVVSSGGRAVGAIIQSGGLLELTGGGVASGTTVDAGGVIYAYGGALGGITSNFGIISSSAQVAGTVIVESGGYDDQDTVLSGGAERVLANGATADFTIAAGAVLSGAGFIQGLAADGDYQAGSNLDDGLVSGLRLTSATGLLVGSGGVASGVLVSALDRSDLGYGHGLFASSGGTLVDTRVASGGAVGLRGGVASDTTILAGGVLAVQSGGALTGVTSNAGVISNGMVAGTVLVQSGGVDNGDAVLSGGVERVAVGGVLENFIVSHGGLISGAGLISGLAGDGDYQAGSNVDYGVASGLLISGTAGLLVGSGGVGSGIRVSGLDRGDLGYGRGLFTSAGGTVVDTRLGSGGTLGLRGGVASNTTVLAGGYLAVQSAGSVVAGATVMSGGTVSGPGAAKGLVDVRSGGAVYGLAFAAGATDELEVGAVESGVTLSAAAALELQGAVVSGALTVGRLTAAQTISGVSLLSGARLEADGAVVVSGGALTVANGGSVSGATVSRGGTIGVNKGGVATDAAVLAGGVLVDNGVAAFDRGAVLAGALKGAGEVAKSGGGALVISGATTAFTGDVAISAGTVELAAATGLGKGDVEFQTTSRFATLQVDAVDRPANGATFSAAMGDFDDAYARVDLAGLRFVSGATATLSGDVLTLVDGAYTAKFTLTGDAASRYVVASDGHGGTLIHAAAGAKVTPLLQAAAGFAEPAAPAATAPAAQATPLVSAVLAAHGR